MYKTKQMYDFLEGLSNLLEVDMNAVTAYKIQKNYNKVVEEYKIIDQVRKDIIEKQGETDKANEEFAKLLDEDVEVTLSKIKIDDLGGANVTPKTLGLIESLIEPEDAE